MKDFDKDAERGAAFSALSPEDQAFIRLLREKAEDTPIPMALQPEMVMARLPDKPAKRRPNWLRVPPVKAVSRAAVVLGAFVFVLAAVNRPVRQYLEGDIPIDPSSGVSESQPVSLPSDEGGSGSVTRPDDGGTDLSVPAPEETSENTAAGETSGAGCLTASRARFLVFAFS